MLEQQIANSLVLGSIYALCALGFTLLFGVAKIINFAYGELLMFGAFFTLTAMNFMKVGFFLALPFAMLILAAFSVLIYLVTIRPVLRGTPLQSLLVTTGVLYVLHELAIIIWGTEPRQMDMGIEGAIEFGAVIVTYPRLIARGTMLLLVLILYWMLYKLRIGKALRAVAQNRAGAEAIGLNVNRVICFAFAVSGAMACAAGALIGALYATEPSMGGAPLLKSFVIVILGGLGNVFGAIVGGLLIGIAETLTGSYISYAFKDVFTFLIMIFALILRPNGLLGGRNQ